MFTNLTTMIKNLLLPIVAAYFVLTPSWVYQAPEGQWINWVAMSADGSRAATGTYKPNKVDTYKYYLFAKDGSILFEDTFPDYQNGVFAISMSDDGVYGAIGGTRKANTGEGFDVGFIKAYNHNTGKVILEMPTEGRNLWIDQSSDGSKMIAGSRNLHFFKLENEEYKLIHTFPGKKPNRSVAMSADGTLAIAGTSVGKVEAFRMDGDQVHHIFSWNMEPAIGKESSIQSVAMDRDGKFFAIAANNGKMYYFSVNDTKDEVKLQWVAESPVGSNVYGVAVSDKGDWVAIGTSANQGENPGEKMVQIFKNVCVIQVCQKEFHWEFETDKAPNPGMQFDQAAKWLVIATGYPVGKPGSFYLVDVPNKEIKMQHVVKDMNWPVAISRDGTSIFGGSDSGEIFYFENSFQK